MGWLTDVLNNVHDITKVVDPVDHYVLDATKQFSTDLVSETSRFIDKVGGDSIVGKAGAKGMALSQRDKDEGMGGWLGRTAISAASIYAGGQYGGDGYAQGAGLGGTETGIGAGESLGSGATYYEAGGGAVSDGAYGLSAGSGSGGGYLESGGGYVNDNGAVSTSGRGVGALASDAASSKTGQTLALDAVKAAAQKKPTTQAPATRPVVEMPDPEQQAEARRRKLAEQLARRGRSASIMTSEGG